MRISGLVLVFAMVWSPASAQEPYKAPRTAHGAPDLQGLWTNKTATPLERPVAFDGPTTTEERATAFIAASRKAWHEDSSDGVGGRQSEWWELGDHMTKINGEIRTSLIIDPPSGKMPFNPEGRARLAKAQSDMLAVYDHPEARPSSERCLTGGGGATGAPLFVPRYNGNYQFVQTKEHLVITIEQGGQVRIIPLRDEPRAGPRRWFGYSRGHWESDTLVVETDGFATGDAYKPASPLYVSEDARVTERFTRISPAEILYEFSVDDPTAFTQTWRGEQLFYANSNLVLETACHEGNYSLAGILAGGRELDRRRAKAKQ